MYSVALIAAMDMAVCQNLVPLVNIKIAGKWMFIPLKMVLIGIDPYPYELTHWLRLFHSETNSLQVIEDHKANHAKLANELRAREAVTGWPSFHPKALKE